MHSLHLSMPSEMQRVCISHFLADCFGVAHINYFGETETKYNFVIWFLRYVLCFHVYAPAVGGIVIQLCKAKGAWVATTCSPRTWTLVKQYNPDLMIDYTIEKWDTRVDLKVDDH